ncbi:hypothetical protein [Helicobacter sp. 12S02232-10]|nr:hypothetical protein [Helicobacter sp. 12S02232-10]
MIEREVTNIVRKELDKMIKNFAEIIEAQIKKSKDEIIREVERKIKK